MRWNVSKFYLKEIFDMRPSYPQLRPVRLFSDFGDANIEASAVPKSPDPPSISIIIVQAK